MSTTKISKSKAMNIPMQDCDSSQVARFGFDDATGTLAMQFKNFKGGDSDVYHYGMDKEVYDGLIAADSKGKYFGEFIKKLDCFRVVDDAQLAA